MSKAGHSCESITCTVGVWSKTQPSCTAIGCQYDSLSVPTGASASGTGCIPGATVSDGVTCSFTKENYVCSTAHCSAGSWDRSTATCVEDIPNAPVCDASVLQSPVNAQGDCQAGQAVADGDACSFTRPWHSCQAAVCEGGAWSTHTPQCVAVGCAFEAVSVPAWASVTGTGCTSKGTVPSGVLSWVGSVDYRAFAA